jgi:hypothetical protein
MLSVGVGVAAPPVQAARAGRRTNRISNLARSVTEHHLLLTKKQATRRVTE